MVIKKRCLLWDYTNTNTVPKQMDKVKFDGPLVSVSNWNSWVPPELKGRAPFRPMIHLKRELSGDNWKFILESKEQIVHFFNEPERNGISPQEAAQIWKNQVTLSGATSLDSGRTLTVEKIIPNLRNQRHKKLVSPSCASDPAGQKWISDWMSLVKDCPPDYLGIHWYGTDSSEARKYIENMHKKFPAHKIIVSEIASISRDQKQVYEFTKNICNWMDGCDYVFEYAFFGCMRQMPDGYVSPAARLMKEDGSFTDLMVKYMTQQPIQ
jgi:hypothetical protein